MDKWLALLRSRRFWAAVVGLIVVIAVPLGYDLEGSASQITDVLTNIAIVVSGWLVSQGLRPTGGPPVLPLRGN